MQANHQWIILGQFGRVYGVKGSIRIHAFTEHPTDLFNYPQWFMLDNEQWIPIERIEEEKSPQRLLVKVKGYDTRERAALLTFKKVGVKQDELPQLTADEYYYFELIGMTVLNTEQRTLGVVKTVLETGANDVLVVEGEQRILIPYLPGRVIKSLCREKKEIVVDWTDDYL